MTSLRRPLFDRPPLARRLATLLALVPLALVGACAGEDALNTDTVIGKVDLERQLPEDVAGEYLEGKGLI